MKQAFDERSGISTGQVFLKEKEKAFFQMKIEHTKKKKRKKLLPKEGGSWTMGKKRGKREFLTKGTPAQTP